MNEETMIDQTIQHLIDSFKDKAQDGMSISEIMHFIFECISTLVEEVKNVLGLPKEDRPEIIANYIAKIYRTVQPDLPWIPEPFEVWIENFVLDYIVPAAIKWIDK